MQKPTINKTTVHPKEKEPKISFDFLNKSVSLNRKIKNIKDSMESQEILGYLAHYIKSISTLTGRRSKKPKEVEAKK